MIFYNIEKDVKKMLKCSFCGREENKETVLVHGKDGATICVNCIFENIGIVFEKYPEEIYQCLFKK